MLVTKNIAPGESVYGEKRISVENAAAPNADGTPSVTKTEYRVWNPFRSKLAAGVLGGLDEIFIKPGAKVLYLGAASGTSVSHVADIVGPEGRVFAVEFSHRSGRDLINMATHRTNVIPIIEDARHPLRYRMLVSMVDVIFADVAQPDQARIVGLNAHLFLKVGGGIVISIKANCIDSTAAPEAVFAAEVVKLREERIKPLEQLTLGTYICTNFNSPLTHGYRAFRERSLYRRRSLCPLHLLINTTADFPCRPTIPTISKRKIYRPTEELQITLGYKLRSRGEWGSCFVLFFLFGIMNLCSFLLWCNYSGPGVQVVCSSHLGFAKEKRIVRRVEKWSLVLHDLCLCAVFVMMFEMHRFG